MLQIFQLFWSHSGYQINWDKSLLFGLTDGTLPPPTREIKLQNKDTFKYLDITITKSETVFLEANLAPQLEWLKRDVAHWRTLPISLMGKAVLFKKMTLPLMQYVLQNTPYKIPDSFFQEVDSELRKLLWDGSGSRIALTKLQRGVYEGGLAIPDIKKYY